MKNLVLRCLRSRHGPRAVNILGSALVAPTACVYLAHRAFQETPPKILYGAIWLLVAALFLHASMKEGRKADEHDSSE